MLNPRRCVDGETLTRAVAKKVPHFPRVIQGSYHNGHLRHTRKTLGLQPMIESHAVDVTCCSQQCMGKGDHVLSIWHEEPCKQNKASDSKENISYHCSISTLFYCQAPPRFPLHSIDTRGKSFGIRPKSPRSAQAHILLSNPYFRCNQMSYK